MLILSIQTVNVMENVHFNGDYKKKSEEKK